MNILDHYITSAPSPQNAVNIFANEWASHFPEPLAHVTAGGIPLFQDSRIAWALECIGGVQGHNTLELGPLEAGHTYMLEKAGAASILAIEANTRAFLKCLIVKELFQLTRAHFLCGDFVEYLRGCTASFDTCVASGVLYHMRNPIELISLVAKVTDRLFLWSHYFDRAIVESNAALRHKFPGDSEGASGGFKCTYHRYEYQEALDHQGFCGGSAPFSNWISRDSILACLRHFGFKNIRTSFEQLDHPNGPALALVATRS